MSSRFFTENWTANPSWLRRSPCSNAWGVIPISRPVRAPCYSGSTLLKDPDDRVRTRAADTLGESQNPQLIAPLMEVLQADAISRELQNATLGALYSHYTKDKGEARSLLDKHMDRIISILKSGKAEDNSGPSFHAVGILAECKLPEAKVALQWAAKSHPNEEVRSYAQQSLAAWGR